MSFHDRNTAIVAALHSKGRKTFKDIGDKFGLTGERIRQIAAANGVLLDRRFARTADPVKLQKAISLFLRGMPICHCADECGFDRAQFRYHLILNGWYEPDTRPETSWTKDNDALLKKRYGKYPGAVAELAEELGTTRNSVIGRAHRLGLARAY